MTDTEGATPEPKNEKLEALTAQIAALEYDLKHIRNPILQKSDEWKDTADHWRFTFKKNGETCDFFTGIGHREFRPMRVVGVDRKEFNRLKRVTLTPRGFEIFLEASKPTKPELKALLYSMFMDSNAEGESFKDWCANYGYDDDSMKAMELYKECQGQAAKLRGLGFRDFEALADYFEGY